MTDQTQTSDRDGGEIEQQPAYNHLEIVDSFHLNQETADELAGKLDAPLGLVEDYSYDRQFLLVRWHDE